MLKKWSGKRFFLIISLMVAFPLAVILAWTFIKTGDSMDSSAILSTTGADVEDSPADPFVTEQYGKNGYSQEKTRLDNNSRGTIRRAGLLSNGPTEVLPEESSQKTIIPRLDLRLAGVLMGGKSAQATIVNLKTNSQGLYRVGDSIMGATVRAIHRDSVVLEKNGAIQMLQFTNGNLAEAQAPSNGAQLTDTNRGLPHFEPIVNETGPPVDESIQVKELPFFQPVTNSTGPPVDDRENYKDLPEFIPFTSENGPK